MKANTIIALLAFILSIAALWIGICQYKEQLQITITHDKLSVKPVLNFETNLSETYKKIGLTIKNMGIGPALIVNQKIYYNGKEIANWSDLTPLIESDTLKFWKDNFPEWYNPDMLTLASNDELDLYNISLSNLADLSKAIKVFDKVSVFCTYTSIYNDTFKINYHKNLVTDSLQ